MLVKWLTHPRSNLGNDAQCKHLDRQVGICHGLLEDGADLAHGRLETLIRLDFKQCAESLESFFADFPGITARVGQDAGLIDNLVEVDTRNEIVKRVRPALALLARSSSDFLSNSELMVDSS